MLKVYDCLTQDHDPLLVGLAALICLFASFTAISLEVRATAAARRRLFWLAAVGAATGSGIWATHFVAMLAFRPDMPMAYEPLRTALSLVIAMVITGIGFGVGAYMRHVRGAAVIIGGAVIGAGVFLMHFTGMAAVIAAATVHYDPVYVVASLIVGIVFATLALGVTLRTDGGLATRFYGAILLTLGICGMHMTGMASASLQPDPTIAVPDTGMPTEWLAFGVAMTTLVILATALISSIVDQHFSVRAEQEAVQLRTTIAELEETKTRLEQTSADLMRALEAAAAGSQAKSQFLAAMSHELRTPLNAIIGFSEAIYSGIYGSINPRQKENLGHIRAAGTHLLQLVNDVLDLSKMDASRLDLDEVELDIPELFRSVIGLLRGDADAAGITVEHTLPEGLPILRGDARRIRQVLINLLSNAIKFTPEGGRVTIDATILPDGLAIAVRDTGIGMAAADIPTALERFGQIDSRLSRRYEGTGLGLPLSKKLMELHDGTLEVASELGSGTTVTITFPSHRVIGERQAA